MWRSLLKFLLLWLCMPYSLTSSRVISTKSLPSDSLTTSSVATTSARHRPGNGFRYEVRFPPVKRNTSGNTQDSEHSESVLTDNIFLPKDELRKNSYGEEKRISSFYGVPASDVARIPKEPETYLPPDEVPELPSNMTDYDEENYLSKQKEIPFHYVLSQDESFIDIQPQGSNTIETSTNNNSYGNTLPPLDHIDTKSYEDTPEVDTYSAVRFTGSVFTEEGLPVLATEMDLPADYSYSYFVRGSPELGHEEARSEDEVTGRFWVVLPDNRIQEVRYTAGPEGYRPTITYHSLQDLQRVRSA